MSWRDPRRNAGCSATSSGSPGKTAIRGVFRRLTPALQRRPGMDLFDPTTILGPGGAIARRLPSYESRPEQLAMGQAVAKSIAEGGHLLVEAGTGVGKSFAYLVPSIIAAVEA